jgi:hypothetical protein
MDRFAAELEVRALAEVDLPAFSLARLSGAERRRRLADLDEAPWAALDERVRGLAGLPLLSGFAPKVMELVGEGDDAPLRDVLLMLAPALIQIIAAMSERWPSDAVRNPSFMGTGGMPDSCYMWRRDGALSAALKDELKSGTLKPRRG